MLQRPIEMRGETIIGQQDLIMLPVPPKHVFVADPCGTLEKSVYCEVLSQWSGKGRIARWNDGHWTSVDLGKGGMHSSYPQIVRDGRRSYIFPEISSGSPPTLFQLGSDGITVTATRELEGLEGTRLVDATLFHVGAMWYLFGGHHDSANYQLQLWTASRLTGPYQPHPRSPICLDPRGARMAGPLVTLGRQAFRFGQDGSVKYGGRVLVHRIDALTREEYKESVCGSIEVAGAWGPHTVNMTPQGTWIDLYREVWAPLAWLRRVQAKASR